MIRTILLTVPFNKSSYNNVTLLSYVILIVGKCFVYIVETDIIIIVSLEYHW